MDKIKRRIEPMNDLAFKKVFSTKGNEDILCGLLDDFFCIGLTPGDITLEHPYSISTYEELLSTESDDVTTILRETRKDISAKRRNADFVGECQVYHDNYFSQRSLYYPFEKFCSGYNAGDMVSNASGKLIRYSAIRPIYALNILAVKHFKDDDALRVFKLYDNIRNKHFPGGLVNLGYFEVMKTVIETEQQRYWKEYFTTGEVSGGAPDYIKKASGIIEYDNLTKEEKHVLSVRERNEQRELSERYTAEKMAENRRFENTKKAITLLKQGVTISKVAKQTGLSVDEVQSLHDVLSL